MSEAPLVYCPKEEKEVPVWYCLGSFTQGRPVCPHLVKATVHGGESAEVECKLDKKKIGIGKEVKMDIKIELLGYKGTLTRIGSRLAYLPWPKDDELLVHITFDEPFPASIISTAISIPVKDYSVKDFLEIVKKEGEIQLAISLEKCRVDDEKRKQEHKRGEELKTLAESLQAKLETNKVF